MHKYDKKRPKQLFQGQTAKKNSKMHIERSTYSQRCLNMPVYSHISRCILLALMQNIYIPVSKWK